MEINEVLDVTGAWDHSTLPANIRVGADCFLERRRSFVRFNSTMPDGLTIGDNVRIYAWTEFAVSQNGRVQIGNDSIIVGAIFMCAERITVGSRVVVSYNVTIADSDFHPRDPALRRLDAVANAPKGDRSLRPKLQCRPVTIEDDVWIGIGAIVLKGVHIGRGARVEAGAIVTSDVPAGATAAGNPARVIAPPSVKQ
jgi:acetyltransferase-like isoleucine patch superfamily enzyme